MAIRHHGVDSGGARDDYQYSIKQADGVIRYTVDALVVGSDVVGAAWTGTLPSCYEAKGLSLCRTSGGLLRSTRHAFIGNLPS
jgi:hypothetical protein